MRDDYFVPLDERDARYWRTAPDSNARGVQSYLDADAERRTRAARASLTGRHVIPDTPVFHVGPALPVVPDARTAPVAVPTLATPPAPPAPLGACVPWTRAPGAKALSLAQVEANRKATRERWTRAECVAWRAAHWADGR